MEQEGKEYFDIRLSVDKLVKDAEAVIDIIDNIGKEAARTGDRIDSSTDKAGKAVEDFGEKVHEVSSSMDEAGAAAEAEAKAMDNVADALGRLVEGQQKQIGVLDEMNAKMDKHVDKSKSLTNEQKKQSDLLVKLMGGQESYNKIMSALPPELQSAISGMQGLIASSQAFIATPIGMVVAALGTSLALLASYFKGATDGEDEFVVISGYAKGVLSALNDEAVDAGRKLYHLFDDPKKSAIDFINNALAPMATRLLSLQKLLLGTADIMKIVFTSDESSTKSWEKIKSIIAENAKAAVGVITGVNIDAAAESLDKINTKAERRVAIDKEAAALAHEEEKYMVRRAEIERELERLRTKRMSASPEEKLKIEAEARKLNNELTNKQIDFAKRELDIAERLKENSSTTYEDKRKVYEAQAKLIQVEIEGERRMLGFVRAASSASNSIQNAAVRNAKEEAKAANNIKMLQEKQKANDAREAKRLALEVKKAEVEGWEEGHAKVMKMLELQGEEELLAVEQKKSDALMKKISDAQQLFLADKRNAGKVFDMTSVEFTPEEEAKWTEYIEAVKQKIAKAEADVIEAERDSMNGYLKEYGTYQERILAIQQIYAKKRKEAKTEGERLLYTQQEKEEIESVKKEFGTSAQAFADLFADASDKSVKSIQRIIDKYKLLMDWMQQGGATGGVAVVSDKMAESRAGKITEQQLKDAGITDEEIQRIKEGKVSLKDFSDQYEKLKGMLADRSPWKSFVSSIEQATEKLKEGEIADGINGIASAARGFLPKAKEFAKSLGNLFGDSDMKDLDDIINGIDGLAQTAEGVASVMSGDIIGGTMTAINGLSALKNALTSLHDNKHEKRIEKLQKNIDNLEEAYKDLERAVERTYGKTKQTNIGLEIESKQKQIELIEKQMQEERDKKKTDDKKVEEWKKQIADTKREIEDLREEAKDAVFGEDILNAIQNFADAYASAWDEGTSKARAAKDTVREMMKKMVSENIKDFMQSSKSMEQLRSKMQEFFKDGVFSDWEQKYLYQMADDLQKELDKNFGWADGLYNKAQQQGGTTGGFATASQDSIDELNGRFTSIQMNTGAIASQMEQIRLDAHERALYLMDIRANTEQGVNIAMQAVGHLAAIEKNTSELSEMNERLDRIERNTRNQ